MVSEYVVKMGLSVIGFAKDTFGTVIRPRGLEGGGGVSGDL